MPVDSPDAVGQHLHREPEHAGVARRFDDAVVGSQSADHESLDAARSKEMFEKRRIRLSALGIAHAETGVPVPPIRTLADDLAVDPELGVEGGSPRVVHAMDRPDPAVGREVGRVLGMPILRVHDERPSVARPLELGIGDRGHVLSTRDVQAAIRVGEVVLDVDDQECGSFVVDRHRTSAGADATSAWEHRRVQRVRVIVSGHVQGVFFRTGCARAAAEHGVGGWVRNRDDGTVEAVFEGSAAAVAAMIAWCRTGPPGASVVRLESFEGAPIGEHGFRITR